MYKYFSIQKINKLNVQFNFSSVRKYEYIDYIYKT